MLIYKDKREGRGYKNKWRYTKSTLDIISKNGLNLGRVRKTKLFSYLTATFCYTEYIFHVKNKIVLKNNETYLRVIVVRRRLAQAPAGFGCSFLNASLYLHFLGDDKNYHPAPWISGHLKESQPSYIWYWMREGPYEIPRSCMEVNFRGLLTNPVSGL